MHKLRPMAPDRTGQIDARFGHKQAVIEALTKWNEEIGTQIGWTTDKLRVTTGSIGAFESTVTSTMFEDAARGDLLGPSG